jgi:hypothetical protein
MADARPFSTFTLQDLSNGIRNTSGQGVLTPEIELSSFRSPRGLQVPTFGSASLILTLASKWGCDKLSPNLFNVNNNHQIFLNILLNICEVFIGHN